MLFQILLVSLTTILTIFLLFLRITRKVYIIELTTEIVQKHIIYFSFLVLMSVILILLSLLAMRKKIKPNKLLLFIAKYIEKGNIFYASYVIVFNFLGPEYIKYLIKLAKYVLGLKEKTKTRILRAMVILPKASILIILVLEIYNKQLNYYYYSLLLLLIPLFFRFILFVLKDLGPRVTPELKELLILENDPLPNHPENRVLTIKFRPEVVDLNLDHFLNNFYYPALFIEGEMSLYIMPQYFKISLMTSLIYHCCNFFCFSYIILFLS